MKARTSLARVVSVVLGSVLLTVLIGAPHDSASAADCKDGYYAIGGHDNDGYGVRGKLKVTIPNTVCMWSNQVAVVIDQNNWVEGGWQERPDYFGDSGKHPWTYRKKQGIPSFEGFGGIWLSENFYYTFKLVSRAVPGTYVWDFYLGGTLLHYWDLGRGRGEVVAQQERWNSADGEVNGSPAGHSHIKELKKANIDRQFVNWSYLDPDDLDVDYRYDEDPWGNTQFWVWPD